jgi:hypothetical protein
MQRSCAHDGSPRGRSWTGPGQAFTSGPWPRPARQKPIPHPSRKDSDGFGSATVPVALAGPRASVCPIICSDLSPASLKPAPPPPISAGQKERRVFGGTPKTAVETTALPKATASLRLRAGLNWLHPSCINPAAGGNSSLPITRLYKPIQGYTRLYKPSEKNFLPCPSLP